MLSRRIPLRLRQHVRFTSISAPAAKPLRSILIANRGEIALRVHRTASQHGIRVSTVYTHPDRNAPHALVTPFSYTLADGAPGRYLDIETIIQTAKEAGAEGIHPGYGFLSENSTFARRCEEEGIVFIGPPASAIEDMGDKSRSKEIMSAAGVPVIPGYHGAEQSDSVLLEEARRVGYPVLIKAVKGGGGKGMRIVRKEEDFIEQLNSARTEAKNSFGNSDVLIERYITTPRHIEVQVFADAHGNCVALGERDCSVQRRHQKILEESPAPNLDPVIRKDIWKKACDAALAVGYRGAGTVEFIFDNDTGEFFFMEMNTRLQVEHPVTEMVTGTDLVHWQLLVASGLPLPMTQEEIERAMEGRGHAIEARIYAENPDMGFMPDSGDLVHLRTPKQTETVRIDAGFRQGDVISSHYDPMIAKLIVQGKDREEALAKMKAALEEYEVAGMSTNIEFIKKVCVHKDFIEAKDKLETGFIEKHKDELFKTEETPVEVYAQAALSTVLSQKTVASDPFGILGSGVSFTGGLQSRIVNFTEQSSPNADPKPVQVTLHQTGPNNYTVTINGKTFENTTVCPIPLDNASPAAQKIESFFPHTRIESTVVRIDNTLTIFQHGRQYRLSIPQPAWFARATGARDLSHSVVAPMPCKVLKVLVKEGQSVKKDEALLIIESMKMETVIRSPQDGVLERIVHGEGDVVKQGTPLCEFASEE